MKRAIKKNKQVAFRKKRTRARITGTAERPRLTVFRSNNYTYAQIIDDTAGKTLVAAATQGEKKGTKTDLAKALGKAIGEKAKKAGVKGIVFDRGQYKYHGRVKALADGVREAGITF